MRSDEVHAQTGRERGIASLEPGELPNEGMGEQLIQCLKQAGLRAVHARSSFLPFGGVIVGIEVTSPTDRAFAFELARALGAATFLKVAYVPPAADARLSADGLDPMKPDAEILVGIKPPPGAP